MGALWTFSTILALCVAPWSSFDGVDFNKSSCPSTVLKCKVFINLLIRKDRIKLWTTSNFSCQHRCTTSQPVSGVCRGLSILILVQLHRQFMNENNGQFPLILFLGPRIVCKIIQTLVAKNIIEPILVSLWICRCRYSTPYFDSKYYTCLTFFGLKTVQFWMFLIYQITVYILYVFSKILFRYKKSE